MDSTDNDGGQAGSQNVSLSGGDPYRTPSEVTEESKRGWMTSSFVWMFVAGVLAAFFIMLALARTQADVEDTQEFDVEYAPYEVEMAAESNN